MKKFAKTNLKASTDYLIVCAIISLGIILISITSVIFSYKDNLRENQQNLKQRTVKAENIINEMINEHSWQIRSLADKVMKSENDLEKINQIISNYNKFDVKSNFDQFLNQKNLFWVDVNDYIVIKNKIGILQYPQKISKDFEVFNSKEKSWQLLISGNLPYFQNDYNVILTSFGVTDINGKYLGSIISSIDIHLILNLLKKNLANSGNVVLLNTKNNKIIFQSGSKNVIKDSDFFTYKLGNVNYEKNKEGFLESEISEQNIKYNYYRKLNNYPMVILSGYDYNLYQSQLLKLILKAIYPNIVIGFFVMVILFWFYKYVVYPAKIKLEQSNQKLTAAKNQLEEAIEVIKKSDIAQIEIIKQIRREISKNTSQAFQMIKILKYNLENQTVINNKINLFLIKNLEQEINNIIKFATDELNKEYVDIYDVINKVALSQEKGIRIRNIKIEINYHKNLPKKVFVDQIRLTQILSSILSKTINLLSEGHQIKINVKTILENKVKYLLVAIEDNGFGIGFKEYVSDVKKLGGREENSINGIDISVETIEELIRLHQGKIIYSNKIGQGSITKIIVPCIKKSENNPVISTKSGADNVIYLPFKK